MMRAAIATPDGPRWTEQSDVEVPEPVPEEALVSVRAFSINRGELSLLRARGHGWRPGQDIAGEVVQPAADGSGPQASERVAGLADWNGWAQYAVVPTRRLVALPDGVGFGEAAALPIAGTTALNLVRIGGSLLGREVLMTGASGGVGGYAVQLATLAGASVAAVASPEHTERLVGYGAKSVVADVRDLPEGAYGLVLESVGGSALAAAIDRVAPGGILVTFGNSSGEPTPFDFYSFVGHEDARVQSYFSYRHEHKAGDGLAVLLDLVAAGRLQVEVGLQENWESLNDALDAMQDRRIAGKAVLMVS
jgi:NADPH:quinone reductase-like Zn-dependent oxidoreductase